MAKTKQVDVRNKTSDQLLLKSARWCSSRLCKLRGFQFRRSIKPGEALILVNTSSIHMFFVFFPIAAVWISKKGKVTSAQLAKPWRPYYASPEPASYVLETDPEYLPMFKVGDEIEFIPIEN